MSKEIIRKTHSYKMQAFVLNFQFKDAYTTFSNLIEDLIIDLKKYIRYMSIQETKSNMDLEYLYHDNLINVETVLYNISKFTSKTDEIVQNIGGLEFSTYNIINQFTNVLKIIENQCNHVIGLYKIINTNFNNFSYNEDIGLDLTQDLLQLEIEFSILQEEIQNSLPKVNLLFDELIKEEFNGKKYNITNQF